MNFDSYRTRQQRIVCICVSASVNVTMRPGRPACPFGPTTQLQSSSSSVAVRFRGHYGKTDTKTVFIFIQNTFKAFSFLNKANHKADINQCQV